MKLTDLIVFLMDRNLLVNYCRELGVNAESEAVLIYLEGELWLDSEVFVFEIEQTRDRMIFEINGLKYFQLFPVDLAIELIGDLQPKDRGYTNLEIADRSLQYRLNDA